MSFQVVDHVFQMDACQRRLAKELSALINEPPPGLHIENETDTSANLRKKHFKTSFERFFLLAGEWVVVVDGARDTLYEASKLFAHLCTHAHMQILGRAIQTKIPLRKFLSIFCSGGTFNLYILHLMLTTNCRLHSAAIMFQSIRMYIATVHAAECAAMAATRVCFLQAIFA